MINEIPNVLTVYAGNKQLLNKNSTEVRLDEDREQQ